MLTSLGIEEAHRESLEEPAVSEDAFLGRQPILDARGGLVAFELLFRGPGHQAPGLPAPDALSDLQTTARVVVHALTDIGIADSLGPYPGYLNADYSMLTSDLVTLLPPERFVLEVLETTPVDAELGERLAQLRHLGYRIALDDVADSEDPRLALLPLVDIVKVDLLASGPPGWARLLERLRPTGKTLLAEKVETLEQFETTRKSGFELFQGYFFSRPQVLRARRVPSSVADVMRVLQLIEAEAGTSALARELARLPALTTRLLRLVNASATGLGRQVDSIGGAIGMIGTGQIGRWAQLMLYADRNGLAPHDDPLVFQVLARARMMELVARTWRPGEARLAEQAFMTGMLSKVDVLLGTPLRETLADLPLAAEVRSALCERDGDLGKLLRLCEAREQADATLVQQLCRSMAGVGIPGIADAETQATRWAIATTGALRAPQAGDAAPRGTTAALA